MAQEGQIQELKLWRPFHVLERKVSQRTWGFDGLQNLVMEEGLADEATDQAFLQGFLDDHIVHVKVTGDNDDANIRVNLSYCVLPPSPSGRGRKGGGHGIGDFEASLTGGLIPSHFKELKCYQNCEGAMDRSGKALLYGDAKLLHLCMNGLVIYLK